ncbi:MAG: hypothetical protein EXQ58_08350 [Acidobacteria bacterium]|nr:hypothetical protein [Acidobacteriota bacterium]
MGGWETTIGGGGTGAFTFSGQVELTSGGADDTNISIAEYYFQQDPTTSAITFSNDGATSADWVALVVTFYQIADHIRVDQEFRSWYYSQDRAKVDQEFRTWYYSKERVQISQQYRTWWYVASPPEGLQIFAAVL